MAQSVHHPYYTLEEYLRLEEMSNVRHEYIDGQIVAMAGGTPEHGAICASVITLLSTQLSGRRCRVFTSDVRVRVQASDRGTYPDASVVCGEIATDPRDQNAVSNPMVLVEVTSPSTEAYDRGDKLHHFQSIPSLREIVIVSHRERRVDVWGRGPDGTWTVESAGPGQSAPLPSIECVLPVDAVYRDPLA